MERRFPFYVLCFILSFSSQMPLSMAASEMEWSYFGDKGPRYWKRSFPDCEGKYQSPIDIVKARQKKNMQPLRFKYYDKQLDDPHLVNDGHTLKLRVKDSRATISGGCLEGDYRFHHLHFHWGSVNDQGSEHTLNGQSFAMEMHIVHINNKYDSVQRALLHGDGLAVLGVFFKVRNFNSSSLEPLVKGAAKIKYINIPVELDSDSLTLESLLPMVQTSFYCYRNGSLTTPDCSTSVTFTLFASPVHIGQKQMDVFRSLRYGNTSDSPFMMDNFRPIQETNRRKIYFYNDSRTLNPVFILLLFMLLISFCTSGVF